VGPRFLLRGLGPSLLPLFTGVRRKGILRTSQNPQKAKFTLACKSVWSHPDRARWARRGMPISSRIMCLNGSVKLGAFL
jgi:hypothetical protein